MCLTHPLSLRRSVLSQFMLRCSKYDTPRPQEKFIGRWVRGSTLQEHRLRVWTATCAPLDVSSTNVFGNFVFCCLDSSVSNHQCNVDVVKVRREGYVEFNSIRSELSGRSSSLYCMSFFIDVSQKALQPVMDWCLRISIELGSLVRKVTCCNLFTSM